MSGMMGGESMGGWSDPPASKAKLKTADEAHDSDNILNQRTIIDNQNRLADLLTSVLGKVDNLPDLLTSVIGKVDHLHKDIANITRHLEIQANEAP
jgi:hypothetical protein